MYIESDNDLRQRLTKKYGVPNLFWYKGRALDVMARGLGLERIIVDLKYVN